MAETFEQTARKIVAHAESIGGPGSLDEMRNAMKSLSSAELEMAFTEGSFEMVTLLGAKNKTEADEINILTTRLTLMVIALELFDRKDEAALKFNTRMKKVEVIADKLMNLSDIFTQMKDSMGLPNYTRSPDAN